MNGGLLLMTILGAAILVLGIIVFGLYGFRPRGERNGYFMVTGGGFAVIGIGLVVVAVSTARVL